jgi:hypothetical protein
VSPFSRSSRSSRSRDRLSRDTAAAAPPPPKQFSASSLPPATPGRFETYYEARAQIGMGTSARVLGCRHRGTGKEVRDAFLLLLLLLLLLIVIFETKKAHTR